MALSVIIAKVVGLIVITACIVKIVRRLAAEFVKMTIYLKWREEMSRQPKVRPITDIVHELNRYGRNDPFGSFVLRVHTEAIRIYLTITRRT